MSAATAITNLLYRYAELMDAGDLEAVAALFERARIKTGGGEVVEGSAPMLALWRAHVRIFPDGTPRTKHVITNPIVEVDEAAGTATCRSYYTVLQQTDDLPLQAICAGRYHDAFVRADGQWHFSERDYSMLDLVGDLSQHLLIPVAA
ncbi:3-phenylpropionate/cinnamic acid dioxygenase small subunit [Sphingobium sp. OAS761]|uniref:nuclear transport factor 2 family protein n=1 Tax=Sphingobium sp. OAS761 TaxID=2817901 RepID=UPI00209EDA58|nr:nuclear transport factor 2 family protein [Sphingobium sp. OAS761]MCP1471726.1 3-phenylpropionate/cinnamic acid dioxygenase small subunit [Sphingobium sp. OAS761]